MSFNIPFNIQLFADDGGSSATASGTATASENTGAQMTENSSTGGQAATGGNYSNSIDDRRKLYADFKKQNKDLFDADVQNLLKKRLNGYSKIKEEKAKQDSLIEILSARYGVKGVDALKDAIEKDDNYWESAAYDADMTVDAYKEKLKRDISSEREREELNTLRNEKQARLQYEAWQSEAMQVKEKYPEFDLNECLKNNRFRSMLTAQYRDYMPSMVQIYEMLFHEDIVNAAKRSQTKTVTDNIRARGLRPDEAGMNNSGGIDYAKSVSSTTKQQRRELAKRARNGELITFS